MPATRRQFKGLKLAYLRCRTFGHRWEEQTTDWTPKVRFLQGWTETRRCESCSTTRREVWSYATGELFYRAYKYPSGYKLVDYELPEDMTLREAMRMETAIRARDKAKTRREQQRQRTAAA